MAKILVPQARWDAVPEAERKKIEEGLRSVGALAAADSLAPADGSVVVADWDPIGDICRVGCDVAAGAALAWCAANTGGVGTALCVAAAEAAREECKRHC